ncbi:hypothetical protein DFQ29_007646 [Apophysomyces sp. BC1021]|nr:hypothetical protein DFQ29_007646 [Apophysomyces sp. BC1021]
MLLLLVLLGFIPGAFLQASNNPAFWQEPFLFNSTDPTEAPVEIKSDSYVATSQGFQTVFAGIDANTISQRLIFDFSFACPSTNTTFELLQKLNHNSLLLPAIRSLPKFAITERGYCNWSEKVALIKGLSDTNNLNITAILIFDNNTNQFNVTYELQRPVGVTRVPAYSNPLPPELNISNMPDNDLSGRLSFVPVYFTPNDYGQSLVNKIALASANTTLESYRKFWQVTAFMKPMDWGDDSNSFMSALASSRGYLSYIIALAAIFLIGVIFLRWWRIRRMREELGNDPTGHGANAYMMQQRGRQLDPLPVDIVNSLVIEKYTIEGIKNANCAICLEDFMENKSDIRVLPCGHGFCVLCIDPWLTQKSTLCPICKWDCMPPERRRPAEPSEVESVAAEAVAPEPSSSNFLSTQHQNPPTPSDHHNTRELHTSPAAPLDSETSQLPQDIPAQEHHTRS